MQYYEKLKGPVSYKKLEGQGKTVYLFGDYHTKDLLHCEKGKDIDFTTFLNYYLTKASREGKIIDIFVEMTPVLKHYPLDEQYGVPKTVDFTAAGVFNSGLIEDFTLKFYGCMNKSKDERVEKWVREKGVSTHCDFPHRFHNVDVRGLMTVDTPFFVYLRDVIELYNKDKDDKRILNMTREITFPKFEEYITLLKVNKQLESCEETIGNKIREYYKFKYIKERYNIMKALKEGNSQRIAESLYYISGYMLDMYTVGRMMRRFKGGETPKDIIVIAGMKHTESIFYVLTECLSFRLINSVDNDTSRINYEKNRKSDKDRKEFRCLSMKEIYLTI